MCDLHDTLGTLPHEKHLWVVPQYVGTLQVHDSMLLPDVDYRRRNNGQRGIADLKMCRSRPAARMGTAAHLLLSTSTARPLRVFTCAVAMLRKDFRHRTSWLTVCSLANHAAHDFIDSAGHERTARATAVACSGGGLIGAASPRRRIRATGASLAYLRPRTKATGELPLPSCGCMAPSTCMLS